MKRYQITVDELELEAGNANPNSSSPNNNKKTIKTIIGILEIIDALILLVIVILNFFSDDNDLILPVPIFKVFSKKALKS